MRFPETFTGGRLFMCFPCPEHDQTMVNGLRRSSPRHNARLNGSVSLACVSPGRIVSAGSAHRCNRLRRRFSASARNAPKTAPPPNRTPTITVPAISTFWNASFQMRVSCLSMLARMTGCSGLKSRARSR